MLARWCPDSWDGSRVRFIALHCIYSLLGIFWLSAENGPPPAHCGRHVCRRLRGKGGCFGMKQ